MKLYIMMVISAILLINSCSTSPGSGGKSSSSSSGGSLSTVTLKGSLKLALKTRAVSSFVDTVWAIPVDKGLIYPDSISNRIIAAVDTNTGLFSLSFDKMNHQGYI
jgi:hypothetical protein